jgi:septation ring formation regulator EzrA
VTDERMVDNEGWREYQKLVLNTLESLNAAIKELDNRLRDINQDTIPNMRTDLRLMQETVNNIARIINGTDTLPSVPVRLSEIEVDIKSLEKTFTTFSDRNFEMKKSTIVEVVRGEWQVKVALLSGSLGLIGSLIVLLRELIH